MIDYSMEIKRFLQEQGASLVGFSNVAQKVSEGLNGYPYAISVGVRLSDAIIDQIEAGPTYTYFHHYRTVNSLIDHITLRGMLKIMDLGGRAIAVPASQTVNDAKECYSGIFPHKTAAVASGQGWIGKNGLFISSAYGPRVRLGTILTDMELQAEAAVVDAGCGSCTSCVDSCPAMALTGNSWVEGCQREHLVDAKACSDYMNAKFKHIGRGSVCGICIKVCPQAGNIPREIIY